MLVFDPQDCTTCWIKIFHLTLTDGTRTGQALIRFDDEFTVRIPIALNHQAHDAVFE